MLGLTAVLTASPTAYLVLKVVGVGYLIFLGMQALRNGEYHRPAAMATPGRGRPFITGLPTILLNAKIAVFYAALLPTLAPTASGAWGLGMLVLIHAGLTLAWLT